jgi:antitoxin StbD
MTEMREPHKVLERSGGKPVAVLKNSALVGYFVPAEAVQKTGSRIVTREEVLEHLKGSREQVQPVLDYLKDK